MRGKKGAEKKEDIGAVHSKGPIEGEKNTSVEERKLTLLCTSLFSGEGGKDENKRR